MFIGENMRKLPPEISEQEAPKKADFFFAQELK
jgi:hypothetical protein